MKHLIFTIILLSFLFLEPFVIYAHPGSVSSDGCHFCRTNCAKWGKTTGTRHGHGVQSCDPSKGPIDPLYSGGGIVTEAPQPTIATTAPTLIPSPTDIPLPTNTPTLTPTNSPTPTEMPPAQSTLPPQTPTITNTSSPEVKGIQKETSKQSAKWWMTNPFMAFLGNILGWK